MTRTSNDVVWQPQSNTNASAGSATRNKDPILQALRELYAQESGKDDSYCSAWRNVLETASGFGEHARHFAPALPHTRFLLTEGQPDNVERLRACTDDFDNLTGPIKLNVLEDRDWQAVRDELTSHGVNEVDVILSINMIHLCPKPAAGALFRHASTLQIPGGIVFLYGAFLRDGGTYESTADQAFDSQIKSRDPHFGLRYVSSTRREQARKD